MNSILQAQPSPTREETCHPSYQSGSEKQGGSDDGGANISCMSCDKFECSEMGPCVKFSYAPGSDEAEKVKAGHEGRQKA